MHTRFFFLFSLHASVNLTVKRASEGEYQKPRYHLDDHKAWYHSCVYAKEPKRTRSIRTLYRLKSPHTCVEEDPCIAEKYLAPRCPSICDRREEVRLPEEVPQRKREVVERNNL